MELVDQIPFLSEILALWETLAEEAQGTILIFCILLGTAIVAFTVSRVVRYLEVKVVETSKVWDDAFFHALRKPAAAFVWLQGIFWAAEAAYRYSEAEIFTYNDDILRVGVVWLIAWTSIRFIREFEVIAVSSRVKHPMDLTTVSAVGKLARAVIILTTALIVMQSLGYSISGVLAFGGIGGIAVGFAAKDLLANFFGGAMVYMDRPFKVGDWIRSPDKNIEGTVERIGWRLTTIRTFDKRPLYVPNSIFTTISVENPSRMSHRRIYEVIGIRYNDIGVMATVTENVREMIEGHDEIDADQLIMVNFEKFSESSLDFFIYCFTKTTNWAKYHAVKQDVLLRISEIIVGQGAEVAFPTRTLQLAEAVNVRQLAQDSQVASSQEGEPRPSISASPTEEQDGREAPDARSGEQDKSEAALARERREQVHDHGPVDEAQQVDDRDQNRNAGGR